MIGDLLTQIAHLKRETDEELEIEPAIEAVVESANRDVADDEVEVFRSVIESGWLDR